jgi:GNAT superfamily N-acetyltransferase
MVYVRPATTQDAEAIHQIYSTITNVSQSSVEHWRQRTLSAILLVADSGSGIEGFGGIVPKALEQLKWLYVHPESQHKGIGTLLLSELERTGHKIGIRLLQTHAAPGVNFYLKHGWRSDPDNSAEHDHEGV